MLAPTSWSPSRRSTATCSAIPAARLSFDTTNPFLTNQARAQFAALGVTSFDLSRASIDLADTSGFSQTNLYRGVAGVRGDFSVGSHNFNYEVSGVYGRTRILDTTPGRQRAELRQRRQRHDATPRGRSYARPHPTTANSVSGFASDSSLVADCRLTSCVPLNVFGEGVVERRSACLCHRSAHHPQHVLEQYVVTANLGGDLFKLFGNTTAFNIGYEHRNEKGVFTPSQFEQQGLGRAVAITPVSGQYNTDEVFGEVQIPLVSRDNGLKFLDQLTVFGRGRYVDNTVNGGFFSWTAGGIIAPIKDISFRGNFTRSFRAPAITELFLPTSNAFDSVDDLCAPGTIDGGPAPANRQRNCAAFLAKFPNATPLDAAAATVPSQSGGNPVLDNEISNSYTFGVVLQPRFVRSLVISADYVRIDIRNPIASLAVSDIVSACFDNADFNVDDPANGNAYCSQIRRYATGQGGTAANGGDRGGQVVVDQLNPGVKSGFVNGNRVLFQGIQGSISYRTALGGIHIPGDFAIDGNMLYVAKRINDITGVAPVRTDGELGDPSFAGQLNLLYIGDGFGLQGSFNYTGEQLFSRVSRGADIRQFDKLDDFVTINPSMYFDVQKKFRLNLAVTNLLNRHGQKINGYVIPASQSDLFGRRYSVNVAVKF